jgi:hypothetical protein
MTDFHMDVTEQEQVKSEMKNFVNIENIPFSLQQSLCELQEHMFPSYVLSEDCGDAINQFMKNICQKIVIYSYGDEIKTKTITMENIRLAIHKFFPFSFDNGDTQTQQSDDILLSIQQVNHYFQCTNMQVDSKSIKYVTTILEFVAKELIEGAADAADCQYNREISLSHLRRHIWGDEPGQNIKSRSSLTKAFSVSHFHGDQKLRELAENVGWTWLKYMPH